MSKRREQRERDLERELRSDLELEAQEHREKGLSPEQAHYAALRAFGNTTFLKEEVRQMWGWTRWDILMQDVRYSLRTLRKSPGFAITAILTLAVGIGASTAVFTVVDSVILKPLAYHDSAALVACWERVRFLGDRPTGPNPRHVDVWQKRATAFSGLTFLQDADVGVTIGNDHPRMTAAVVCIPNLFDILQVHAFRGRTFVAEDGVIGHENVAILSYQFWHDVFHGDPDAIGKTLRIADVPHEIVGILPSNFQFPNANALPSFRDPGASMTRVPDPAIFYPAALDLTKFEWNGNYGNWVTLGRLKPGFSARQAEAQLNAIQEQIVMPAGRGDHRPGSLLAAVQPMQEAVVSESRSGLWMLMSAVLGLMLIACLNLANAQLGRAHARRREAAVRTALGAAKWRLVWDALAENLLLAVIGGAAGVALAYVGLDLFRRYSPVDLPRLSEVRLDWTVLLFSAALILAASLLSGMLPALRMLAADPQVSLQQSSGRTLGSRQGNRLRRSLIGLQVFGCTALLLLTALFSKSLLHLLHQDKGFETGHTAIAEVRLPPKTYAAHQSRVTFDDAVLENLHALPGAESAALVSAMPLEGESWMEPVLRVDKPNLEGTLINLRWASPGYLETTRQRLIAGRFLEERDRNLNTTVLSEGEAKALWGNEDPIGGEVRIEGKIFRVVGIVADSRNTSLKTAPPKMAYVHYAERAPYRTFFIVRSAQPPDSLMAGMRQAIWKYAPDITLARVKTLDAQLNDSLATERFQTMVLLSFGTAALLLAMLGIYGVLNYSVATRKQEIGVRMAIGATKSKIYALTLSEAGAPVMIGLSTGLGAGIAAERLVRKLLYGVEGVDATAMLIVAGLFMVSAAAAAFVPARRAASVDPMEALRAE